MIMLKIALIFLLSYIYCRAGRPGWLNNHLIKEMKRNLKDLQSMHVHNGENSGETYIRWGKTTCPEESNLVYDGYAAGKHHSRSGSGSNLLCLPKNPEWKDHTDGENTGTGKVTCHDGWHKEFSGYLMSQTSSNGRTQSEYICADDNLETVPGGDSSHDNAVLYPVEAICGSLKCPPYVKGREFTCGVCSK